MREFPAPVIRTPRLAIRALMPGDARALHQNSLDEDNRRFVPDEVFETMEDAQAALEWLTRAARTDGGPYVRPVCLADGRMIGYVQACRIPEGWEVGYHIASAHTGRGYATEALRAFLPEALRFLGVGSIDGVALEENAASHRVLEKCGFRLLERGMGQYQGERRAIRRYRYFAG